MQGNQGETKRTLMQSILKSLLCGNLIRLQE